MVVWLIATGLTLVFKQTNGLSHHEVHSTFCLSVGTNHFNEKLLLLGRVSVEVYHTMRFPFMRCCLFMSDNAYAVEGVKNARSDGNDIEETTGDDENNGYTSVYKSRRSTKKAVAASDEPVPVEVDSAVTGDQIPPPGGPLQMTRDVSPIIPCGKNSPIVDETNQRPPKIDGGYDSIEDFFSIKQFKGNLYHLCNECFLVVVHYYLLR